MKKFTCGHCGGRIAVTPKHLGKLVVCPECGKPTHPLAADILAAVDPPANKAGASQAAQRTCENCGRQIGRLEQLQLWNNHLVCEGCHDRLTESPIKPAAATKATRGRKKTPAKVEESPQAALPVVVERAPVPAARQPQPVGISIDPAAVKVAVGRVAAVASTVANLPPLQLRHRLLILLGVLTFAGVAIYGALTLLRDLAGLITTVALILLAVTAVVALMRSGLSVYGRWRVMQKEPSTALATTKEVSSDQ